MLITSSRFESLLTNEFHTLEGTCSVLVPSGVGYEDVSLQNQVCTTAGSLAGQSLVNGARYAELVYGYSYSHTWRVRVKMLFLNRQCLQPLQNLGVVLAFGFAFIALLLGLTERNSDISESRAVMLFKRGTKSAIPTKVNDEEKAGASATDSDKVTSNTVNAESRETPPPMTDVFTWQHLTYTVPISGGPHRQLLNDISGYVAPGKLTALMGESGAGKLFLTTVAFLTNLT